MKTKEELKQIAIDMYHGRIFTTGHIPERDVNLTQSIFMGLVFLDKEQIDNMQKEDIAVIYEYLSEAGERSINGYPMFLSFKTLNKEEWKIVLELYNKLKEFENNL